MKAYRYINLSSEDLSILSDCYRNSKKHHLRERCHALLLSHRKYKIKEIAKMLGKQDETIRHWYNQWDKLGLKGLEIQAGRGVKALLQLNDGGLVDFVKKKVYEQPLKLVSILSDVSKYVGISVSKDMLQKFIKSLGYSYHRIRKSLKQEPDADIYESKVLEMMQLISLEKQGFLKTYYADECGFNETPCVPYGWQCEDAPLSIPTSRGQRWNVFGIMSSDNQLFTHKTKNSIKSDFVINAIEEFAQSPLRAPRSVIIIDNAAIHHSEAFTLKIPHWQQQGVEIFYLPTYSPHLNRIETFWRKCKYEWLLPQDYASWKDLTRKLERIFEEFGTTFNILFQPF